MSGHWICDRCGYDGEHAEWCVYLRPSNEQWKGHRTKDEMKKLKPSTSSSVGILPAVGWCGWCACRFDLAHNCTCGYRSTGKVQEDGAPAVPDAKDEK